MLLEWFHVKHVGVGWFAGWLFESVVSPLWVARDWSGSFNCVFHVKQSQLQNHEGKAENSRLGNTLPPFQLFPRSVFHLKHQLIFQAVIHIEASKSHKHIQTNCPNSNTPTFHVKHQASATNRGKATHPKRYLLQLNHPIMFHVKPLFHIPHSPNLRFTWNIRKLSNVRKAQH